MEEGEFILIGGGLYHSLLVWEGKGVLIQSYLISKSSPQKISTPFSFIYKKLEKCNDESQQNVLAQSLDFRLKFLYHLDLVSKIRRTILIVQFFVLDKQTFQLREPPL